jgi:Tfp pilus assembly PilM family ATPase
MGHLSIDFRTEAIRLLETDGSAKALKVKKFRLLKPPSPNQEGMDDVARLESVSESMGKLLSKEKFTRDPAGMALGSSYSIFRDLELPFKNEDQIRKVIKFEVEGSIQSDIEDMVITFFKKTESIDKSYLMVLGVKKSTLREPLELLQSRDVDPYFVDLDMLSMFNALSATGYLAELENFFVINCSYESTQVMGLSMGRMFAGRSIPLGVGTVVRALQHDVKMARITEANHIEEALGITPLDDMTVHALAQEEEPEAGMETDFPEKSETDRSQEIIALAEQRRSEFLTKLRRELVRTLSAMNPENQAEKIFITGAACTMPGIKELFQELIGAEVEELDLLSRVEHPFEETEVDRVNREIGIALGTAYKSAGHDVTRVDFRQEDLQYAKKFDQVKLPLACLIFLLMILIVLLNVELFKFRQAERIDIERITQMAQKKLQQALEDNELADQMAARFEWGVDRVRGITRQIENKGKELGNQLGREGTIPKLPSVFPVWHQFFAMVEKNVDQFELFKLNKMKIQMMQKVPLLTFDCEVATGEDESKLERFLENVPIFSKVKRSQSRPTADGKSREMKDMQVEIDLTKMEEER